MGKVKKRGSNKKILKKKIKKHPKIIKRVKKVQKKVIKRKPEKVVEKVIQLSDQDIEMIIRELIGEDALPLIKELKGKKDVSEFKLVEKLGTSINQIRNIIYKLDQYNLVSSIRKKDKKKGWYIYYWTFNPMKAYDLIVSLKRKKIEKLKETLNRELKTNYYICPKKCVRLDSVNAMEQNFKCPECGKILQQEDKEKRIKIIKKEIFSLEQDLDKLLKLASK